MVVMLVVACGGSSEVSTSTTAIEAAPPTTLAPVAADDPFGLLTVAAGDAFSTAALVSEGLATSHDLEGDADSPAAATQTALATLLSEHVYLAGIMIDSAVGFGLESPAFAASASALDRNTVALADVVGSVAPEQRDAFLSLWRDHIGFFVDYTVAASTDDDAGRRQALQDLAAYGQSGALLFSDLTDGLLTEDAVRAQLAMHVDSVIDAIEAAAVGDPAVFGLLRAASHHVGVGGMATELATAISQAAGLEGDVSDAGPVVGASMAVLMREHVYLAGVAVKTAYVSGAESTAFTAVVEQVGATEADLAEQFETLEAGSGDEFLRLWSERTAGLVGYALAVRAEDETAVAEAESDLGETVTALAGFFESVATVAAGEVEAALTADVASLSDAVDALAAFLSS